MSIQPGKDILVTVLKAEAGVSKNKGTPCVFFKFENSDGQIDGEIYFTETTADRNINTLRKAFGFNDDWPSIGAQAEGKECLITVEDELYNGKNYSKVKWVNALRDAAVAPPPDLFARLKKLSLATPRAEGLPKPNPKVTPKPAPAPAAAPVADDECPY